MESGNRVLEIHKYGKIQVSCHRGLRQATSNLVQLWVVSVTEVDSHSANSKWLQLQQNKEIRLQLQRCCPVYSHRRTERKVDFADGKDGHLFCSIHWNHGHFVVGGSYLGQQSHHPQILEYVGVGHSQMVNDPGNDLLKEDEVGTRYDSQSGVVPQFESRTIWLPRCQKTEGLEAWVIGQVVESPVEQD